MSSESQSNASGNHDKNDGHKSNNHKIFVTNLDGNGNEEELKTQIEGLFKDYGTVCSVVVRKSRNAEYCFAFVEYKEGEDAQNAIKNLDQTIIGGKKVKVEYQDNGKRRKDANKGCYTCGKMGHFARECRSKNDSYGYRGRSRSRSRSKDSRKKTKKRRQRSDSSERSRSPKAKKQKKNRSKSREEKDKKKKKSKRRHRSSSED